MPNSFDFKPLHITLAKQFMAAANIHDGTAKAHTEAAKELLNTLRLGYERAGMTEEWEHTHVLVKLSQEATLFAELNDDHWNGDVLPKDFLVRLEELKARINNPTTFA